MTIEKVDFSNACWNSKRKLGVTMHFSEIIELKLEEKVPHNVLYVKAF